MSEPSPELQKLLQDLACVMFPDHPEQPVTLQSRGYDGDSALHVVLWQGNETAAQLLIDAGAEVNAAGEMGETPLHVAARQASAETLARLLCAGARLDSRSEFGQTAADLARAAAREAVWQQALQLARRHRPGKQPAKPPRKGA